MNKCTNLFNYESEEFTFLGQQQDVQITFYKRYEVMLEADRWASGWRMGGGGGGGRNGP